MIAAFTRFACWLSRGDNAFITLNCIVVPPLLAVTFIGIFGP